MKAFVTDLFIYLNQIMNNSANYSLKQRFEMLYLRWRKTRLLVQIVSRLSFIEPIGKSLKRTASNSSLIFIRAKLTLVGSTMVSSLYFLKSLMLLEFSSTNLFAF
jgi:hypothetical protein